MLGRALMNTPYIITKRDSIVVIAANSTTQSGLTASPILVSMCIICHRFFLSPLIIKHFKKCSYRRSCLTLSCTKWQITVNSDSLEEESYIRPDSTSEATSCG